MDTYQLLPKAAVTRASVNAAVRKFTKSPEPSIRAEDQQMALWSPQDMIDQLTVAQARTLHLYLQRMFGK